MYRFLNYSIFLIIGLFIGQITFSDVRKTTTPEKGKAKRAKNDDYRKTINRAYKQMALRHRFRSRPLKINVVSQKELNQIREEALEMRMRKDFVLEDFIMKMRGILPEDSSYQHALKILLLKKPSAFFDMDKRKIYWSKDASFNIGDQSFISALNEKLIDGYLPLKRYFRLYLHNSDRLLARRLFVAGIALAHRFEFLLKKENLSVGGASKLTRELVKLQQSRFQNEKGLVSRLNDPPLYGLLAVQRLIHLYGWESVNRKLKRPYKTTEELMHPKKSKRFLKPIYVRAKALPIIHSMKTLVNDTRGEMQIFLYLKRYLTQDIAERAASGWGGDTLVIYRDKKEGKPLLIHMSAWDSIEDAIEYQHALMHIMQYRFGLPLNSESKALAIYRQNNDFSASVERKNNLVVEIIGAKTALRSILSAQIWKNWLVQGRRGF